MANFIFHKFSRFYDTIQYIAFVYTYYIVINVWDLLYHPNCELAPL